MDGVYRFDGYDFRLSKIVTVNQGVPLSFSDTMAYASHILRGTLQYEDLLLNQTVDFPIGSQLILSPLPLGSAPDIATTTTVLGRYELKNLTSGQYRLTTQTTSATGLLYNAILPTLTIGQPMLADQPVLATHNLPGTLIVSVLDNLGTPQSGSTICGFTNAALWDSVGCTNALASATTYPTHGKAVFQRLYPGATYFFFAQKIGADTLEATDTVFVSQATPTFKTIRIQ